MHKWWQSRWVAPTLVYPQGIVHQRRTPEAMTRTIEESEQVLGQSGPSMHMAGILTHHMEYQQEDKLPEPEEDSHRTGAHDTQLIDLPTENRRPWWS
jgi:hypothetical protein